MYLESIGNPKNDIPDFFKISALAHKHGLPVMVDNTVSPGLIRTFDHGVDINVYSTTKFLGGHGVHVGGAVVDSGKFIWEDNPTKWPEFCAPSPSYHGAVFTEALKPLGNLAYIIHMRTHWLRDTGGMMSPFAAFLFLLGVETLHLRMERHTQNAQALAEWLAKHKGVEWVNYAGLPDNAVSQTCQEILPERARRDSGLRDQGRKRGGRQVHQQREARKPPGQCRRCENAGDSAVLHYALAVD